MKIKLTHSQLQALGAVLRHMLNEYPGGTNHERLVAILMEAFYKKLAKKYIEGCSKYTVTVPPETAIAFYEFFIDTHIEDLYGRTVINTILMKIDQHNYVKSL